MKLLVPIPACMLLVLSASFGATDCIAASNAALLTAQEQRAVLNGASIGVAAARPRSAVFLAEIERSIRDANAGADAASLRRPVSDAQLKATQRRLALRGHVMSMQELRAATDYSQALLRESPRSTLQDKVNRLPSNQRKAFHGVVAEFAEARKRGIVLTKDKFSRTWDLTEANGRPRNYQMKIYAKSDLALRSLLDDLPESLDFQKGGILTQDTIDRQLRAGRVVRDGRVYRPVGRPDIELHPSRAFGRPAQSHIYAQTGRTSLVTRGAASGAMTKAVPLSNWAKVGGIAALVVTQGYLVQGVATGRISDREFVTAQSAIAGGAGGAWAGAASGAWLGSLVPPPFTPAGIAVGGVIGGVAGAVLGAKIAVTVAVGIYGLLDEEQQREVAAQVYKAFDVAYGQ